MVKLPSNDKFHASNLYGSRPVVFITKQTTHMQSNTGQVALFISQSEWGLFTYLSFTVSQK